MKSHPDRPLPSVRANLLECLRLLVQVLTVLVQHVSLDSVAAGTLAVFEARDLRGGFYTYQSIQRMVVCQLWGRIYCNVSPAYQPPRTFPQVRGQNSPT